MPSVDDRIVRMEFDNASFEKKLATTLTSIDKLNKSLKFEGAQKGLSGISTAASKVDFSTVSNGIENVSKKFLALSTVAITILSNITTAGIRAGLQLAKSLSLDQIISGFQEYETNMRSIQTILANTRADGTNLQQVTDALDVLNEYSDKTIYNFGEMARNIGTFTAAGVDLDTSVQSIKGISNLAAISGSSAEQASSAMYQLSQAISTGTLRLIDWNSVVNAGMGGEVFQKALFETGKTLGTIKDIPIDQTFEEWTSAGNSFRGSLEQEWLTAEVLTTTLQGFTGELTEAQLLAIGYTKEQAAQIMELGRTGVEAATKVRTFSQLVQTTKESIASGWSQTFRIFIGNFEEATELFTNISNAIGGFVSKSADARNALLQGWADLGGRLILIDSLKRLFENLFEALRPIKEAFRDIFPAQTSQTLFDLTKRFSDFVDRLNPAGKTIQDLRHIFRGFFALLETGWTVIKEGAKFVVQLFTSLTGAGSGKFLDFAAKIGDFFTELNAGLVDAGAITDFFEKLVDIVQDPIPYLEAFRDVLLGLFTGFDPDLPDKVSAGMGRIGDRFESLKSLFGKAQELWEPFANALEKVMDILDRVWEAISNWFSELGQKMADAMGEGDFDAVLDFINASLFGGIALLLAKFLKSGINFDVGAGFLEKIGRSFEELTGVLKAMQTDIKANALLKIAGAIAVLTASVLVLSLIDSAALTKALTAMAVGFGQLMATFAILTKLSLGPTSAASFSILAAGMILLSSAILILSGATAILAQLDWDELARGLTGVTVLIGVMTAAAIVLSKNSGALLLAGAGMTAMAIALSILAGAVKLFGMMDWGELAKGMGAIAILLVGIGLAMNLFPATMPLIGVGLLAVAVAMNILAGAMMLFATMSWGDIAKGIVSIAGALVAIGLAMHLMPATLPITAAGLVLVGVALNLIGKAMQTMGGLSWGEIGKGLAALAGALLILAVATNAMTGAIGGAIAIGIVSASLMLLAEVLQTFAGIKMGDLLRGLIGIAAALAVLGVAAMLLQPAIGSMLALGAALLLIGAGFALFGLGAQAVAKAFELLAKVGAKGSKALVEALKAIGLSMGALGRGIAEGILELLMILGDAAPVIAEQLAIILAHIIDGLITLVPKLGELISVLLTEVINLLREKIPEYAQMGIDIIVALLEGIRDNIDDVVIVVGEIIVAFIDALAEQVPKVIAAGVNLFTEMMLGIAEGLGRISSTLLVGVAVAFVRGFLAGLEQAAPGPMRWFRELPGKIIGWIGNVLRTLWSKGVDIIGGFFGGVLERIGAVNAWFLGLGKKVLGWVGSLGRTLWDKGYELIRGFWDGIWTRVQGVINWFRNLPDRIKDAIGDLGRVLWNVGRDLIQGMWDGIKNVWDSMTGWISDAASHLPGFIKGPLGIGSPSKVFMEIGENIIAGLTVAFDRDKTLENSSVDLIDRSAEAFRRSLSMITENLGSIEEFNPTITPVLDLSQVALDAQHIQDYLGVSPALAMDLTPTYSLSQARRISEHSNAVAQDDTGETNVATSPVTFNQTINAPEQLSTADIYRQTRNQLAMAKEELSIP